MSTSDVERWREDSHAFREIWKSINLEDDVSLWDAAMKQSVLAKVLAKDAFKLEAIDAWYLKIFNEQMKYIDMHLNSLKEIMNSCKSEKFKPIFEISFGMGLRILYLLMNNQVSLLSFSVAKKIKDEKEILEQGKRLKEIQEKQQRTLKEKMGRYVA